MKRICTYILFSVFSLVSFAGEADHFCSGYHSYDRMNFSTHVSDPGLLKYDVRHYGISLEVNDTNSYITGYTDILAVALEEIEDLVFELNDLLGIDSILLNGKGTASFTHSLDLIRIKPDPALMKDELFKVRVYYDGRGAKKSYYSGISNRLDGQWNTSVTYTLSEPFMALDWFVCKQVLTDKADSADIYITVDEGLMAGSNGLLKGIDSLDGNKLRFHWHSGNPIAYYLLSLSVSDYQDYSFYSKPLFSGDSLLVQNFIYNAPGCLEQNKEDIDFTDDLLELYSDLLTPYPYMDEKYGHCLAPIGGGMEHQTMTTLSSFRFILVAHELTHQWFGDNVTCASWQDIWINEGFASYGEYLALEKLKSQEEASNWMVNAHTWALSEPKGSVYIPEQDAGNSGRIFSRALSYKKGAAILHMIRYELGNDKIFFKTLSEFQDRFSESAATGEDFLNVLNETSGKNFDWFFQQWYYGQGFPYFSVQWWQSSDSLNIEVRQEGSSEQTPLFKTHLDFRLYYEDGSDTVIRASVEESYTKISILPDHFVTALVVDPLNQVLEKTEIIHKYPQNSYFSVNPNPFGEELNIVFLDGTGTREIFLTDLNGKVLKTLQTHDESVSLDTQNLVQGLYLLKVKEGKESYTTKVVRH